MRLTVTNYKSIASAQIELGKITLIAGQNRVGKTSIAEALSLLLTGKPIPDEIKKKDADWLVGETQRTAWMMLECADAETHSRIELPKAEYHVKGSVPAASAYATGMQSFLALPAKERSKVLSEYLQSVPEMDELFNELNSKSVKLSKEQFKRLWDSIQGIGWEGTYAHAKETGARLKGRWEQVTGDRYGAQKAANWFPPIWTPNMDREGSEGLNRAANEAKKALEQAIGKGAVFEADADKLSALIKRIPAIQDELGDLKNERALLERDERKLSETLTKIPKVKDMSNQWCPFCKKPLFVDKTGKIIAGSVFTKETKIELQKNMQEIGDMLNRIAAELSQRNTKIARLENELQQAQEAQKKPAKKQTKPEDVEAAREASRVATERLDAFNKKSEADKIQEDISINQEIVAILSPTGLQKRKLTEKLTALNVELEALSKIAGCETITITNDLDIHYGGLSAWQLCSTSEQYKIKSIIQLMLAKRDKSEIVIFDGADVLDPVGRNHLMRLVLQCGISALVCMTLPTVEDVPDMRKVGGKAYWIEGGKAKELYV